MAVKMSKKDQDELTAAGEAWTKAHAAGDQAGMDAAHAKAESIRNSYGYSGGSDGSKYIPVSALSGSSGSKNSQYTGGLINNGKAPSYAGTYKANDLYGVDNQYAKDIQMTERDLALLTSYGEQYNKYAAQREEALANATSDLERSAIEACLRPLMNNAHKAAEEIRAKYGYSGGDDGSEFITGKLSTSSGGGSSGGFTKPTKPVYDEKPTFTDKYATDIDAVLNEILTRENFKFEDAPTFVDKYGSEIEGLMNDIRNRDDFSYDASVDPLYQQYQTQYRREGERAMKDTLGQVSARTGGMASSYATSAAQQANNYYNAQLADRIPELYQLAYSMYMDDLNTQMSELDMLRNASNTDYGRYRDSVSDWKDERNQAYAKYLDSIDAKVRDLGLLEQMSDTQYNRYRDTMSDWRDDRNFAYGEYRDDVGDYKWQEEFDYNAMRDQIADKKWQDEFDYNIGRNQVADKKWQLEQGYTATRDQVSDSLNANALAYERAMEMLEMGVMPDSATLESAGLSSALASNILEAQKVTQNYTGSGGSENSYTANDDNSTKTPVKEEDKTATPTGYDNGGLTDAQVKALQSALGVETDGKYGPASQKAAGGLSAKEAYNKYVTGKAETETDAQVGNNHGDSWVYVPGYGRLSYQELEAYVDKGEIKESMNNGKYWYTKAR